MFFTDVLSKATNYVATLEVPGCGGPFVGLVDDDAISIKLGTRLTDNGNIGGGLAQKLEEKIVGGAVEAVIGQNITKMMEAYTLRKPISWTNPEISLKVTFFDGVDIGGEGSTTFKAFNDKLAKAVLPKVNKMGILESHQVDWTTILKIMTSAATGGFVNYNQDVKEKLATITIGTFFHSQGWWLTDTPVSVTNIYDNNGKPIVWDTTFTFEYFKQMTSDEWIAAFQ